MIDLWLDFPAAGILGVLTLLYGMTASAIFWLTFRSPLSGKIQSCSGLVGPYFGAVAILFALLTGFLAAEVSDRNRQAARSVQAESEALLNLHTLSIASATDMAHIRNAIHVYARSVLAHEWPRMAYGAGASQTEAALADLMQTIAEPKIAAEASQAVHTGLMTLALRVAAARSDRLALAADRTNAIKWATLLFLCFMTQVALAMVHLERPRAQAAALAIFSIAAVVTLGLIAEQEAPFSGTAQVSRAPLERVLMLQPTPSSLTG